MREWLPVFAEARRREAAAPVRVWLARLVGGSEVPTFALELRGASSEKAKRELGWAAGPPELAHGLRGLVSRAGYVSTIARMPDRLYFTDSDEANALIATDPMALLIGFALDQQVTVQKAFMGPLAADASAWARSTPSRWPRLTSSPSSARGPPSTATPATWPPRARARWSRARPLHGDAARVWTDAADGDELRANVAGLPASAR